MGGGQQPPPRSGLGTVGPGPQWPSVITITSWHGIDKPAGIFFFSAHPLLSVVAPAGPFLTALAPGPGAKLFP